MVYAEIQKKTKRIVIIERQKREQKNHNKHFFFLPPAWHKYYLKKSEAILNKTAFFLKRLFYVKKHRITNDLGFFLLVLDE